MDAASQNTLATHFRSLHVPGNPVVLTNVYDGATAKIVIANPNAKAVATASYAIAATYGVDDNDMTLEQNLEGIKKIAAVVVPSGLPLTADLQDGYDDVADTIRRVIALGVVGCNLEDANCKSGELREFTEAVGRVRTAVQTAAACGVPDFAVNGRTDVLSHGGSIEDVITRGNAYLDAGANTVFVLGGRGGRGLSMEEVNKLVDAFDGKLNVFMKLDPGFAGVEELKKARVARISVGPGVFRKAMAAFSETVAELLS